MTVNAKCSGSSKTEEYPRLMIDSSGMVVLFEEEEEGTVVATPRDGFTVGEYRSDFDMDKFNNFTGTVELKNN